MSLESVLKELPGLKPPGVSGSRIKKCTQIALDKVSEESSIVSTLYLQCKTTPLSHKLGMLYVIDSITRAYVEDAKKKGIKVDESAPEGTSAAGAYKISTYIESLIDDTMGLITNDKLQKEKISKLVDIWERSQTFDSKTINSIRSKYFKSSTPPGSPPPSLIGSKKLEEITKQVQDDPMALLQTLASLNKEQGVNTTQTQQLPQPNLNDPNAIFNMLKQMGHSETAEPSVSSRSQNHSEYSRRDRSRSPMGRYGNSNRHHHDYRDRNSPSMTPPETHQRERNIPGTPHYRERVFSYDNSLPNDTIKVASRTLFIGGVPQYMDERELASILRPYAEVQSVILNSDKKHAFVKVYSRGEAEQVLASFNQSSGSQLRTRWGVGFGPRDCCDYQNGISLIPISRLTELDKRWIVAAEWGGTGGKPLVPGLVIDEPDIEIGAGVSSKAISRKMPTNSARNGPRSNRPGEPIENVVRTDNYLSNPYQNNNNAHNPLQNLFNGQQQQQQPHQRMNSPPVAYGQPLQQQLPQQPSNVNSIMQSLTLMMQPQQQQQPPAQMNQQQPLQPGLTPELQLLLAKMNNPK